MHMPKGNRGPCRGGNDGAASRGTTGPPGKANPVPCRRKWWRKRRRTSVTPILGPRVTPGRVAENQTGANPTYVSHCEANWVHGFFIKSNDLMGPFEPVSPGLHVWFPKGGTKNSPDTKNSKPIIPRIPRLQNQEYQEYQELRPLNTKNTKN